MTAARASLVWTLGLWTLLLLSDTGGQLFLKLGSSAVAGLPFGSGWIAHAATAPWVLAGVACYASSFFMWMVILNRTSLSFAFPVTALVYITVLLASWFALGEVIDGWRWTGVAVILFGVFVLGGDGP
ncbi:MAG TPA: EamA family transporter [Candidatus Cybelea sp.]|nr:EamA family transporter [Candidatus Cybelea sp.]